MVYLHRIGAKPHFVADLLNGLPVTDLAQYFFFAPRQVGAPPVSSWIILFISMVRSLRLITVSVLYFVNALHQFVHVRVFRYITISAGTYGRLTVCLSVMAER